MCGEMLTSPEVNGNVRNILPVVPAGGSPLAAVKVNRALHSVLIHADPAGQHAAVGTLSPSDCHPAGPAGPYVVGGPVGSHALFQILEPLEHSVLDHTDPAGQHIYAAVGTLSPSDCLLPCWPSWPVFCMGHCWPRCYLKVLEPLEHSVLNHADPAGQHAVAQDTVESLEHSVLETILEGRPMEGITCSELLKCTLLSFWIRPWTVDWLRRYQIEKISSSSGRYPGRSTYGGDYQPGPVRAFGSGGVSGQWTHMEGMLSLEPLEQSVLNTLLVARPMEGTTETDPPDHSALASQLDFGQSNLESPTRPMLDITQDEITDTDPSERSVLATHLEHGLLNLETLSCPMVDVALDRRPMESSGLAMAPIKQ